MNNDDKSRGRRPLLDLSAHEIVKLYRAAEQSGAQFAEVYGRIRYKVNSGEVLAMCRASGFREERGQR